MIYFLIGHRGVGKSQLLKALSPKIDGECIDLDAQIEKRENKSISNIFPILGESEFRVIENRVLQKAIEMLSPLKTHIVALGAGFNGPISGPAIWVRRSSDKRGRIFFDRPRLDQNVSPLKEYLARYETRSKIYRENSVFEFILPEGEEKYSSELLASLINKKQGVAANAVITLLPEYLKNFEKRIEFWRILGIKKFELRSDLLSPLEIKIALELMSEDEVYFSFRRHESQWPDFLRPEVSYDWPLEWGESPLSHNPPLSYSIHDKDLAIKHAKEEGLPLIIGNSHPIIKIAPSIENFEELQFFHNWFLEDPEHRSFLPCSKDGRWNWYRTFYATRMPLIFVREGEGSASDQPTIYQFSRAQDIRGSYMAAILGDPVDHSYTPSYHSEFFKSKRALALSIPLKEEEVTIKNLSILQSLGLRFAAVTSPLKQVMFRLIKQIGNINDGDEHLNNINTIWYNKGHWTGANTDQEGARSLLQPYKDKVCAIWGAGATSQLIHNDILKAQFYSARSGKPIDRLLSSEPPEVLIWTVGRNQMELCQWPPEKWKPKVVVDLNYSEDSPGREYSLVVGSKYISGIEMFHEQANRQQKLWATVDPNI